MQPLRWGVIGTGRMAAALADEFKAMPRAEAVLGAVASRDRNKAESFAHRHGLSRSYDDYRTLLQDPEVDAVYIATPHTEHQDCMLAAIHAGKTVLCEKPFTINAVQARRVRDAARNAGVFAMEAMWSRFLPAIVAARELVAAGRIGQVQMITGGGAFVPDRQSDHYLLDRLRGGGVLLDAGVYLISLTSMLLGTPTRIQSSGRLGGSGVDEQVAILLDHADGANACLYVSLHARRAPDLEVLGDAGRMRIAAPLFRPTSLTLWDDKGLESAHDFPIHGSGYGYQIKAVHRALRAGLTECADMPLDESLNIMATMDMIRQQMNLVYPAEQA